MSESASNEATENGVATNEAAPSTIAQAPALNVLVGVTGGIAAVKIPALVRRLRERGHSVRCVMTRSARSFVSPLSLEVLTGHAVYGEEYLEPNGSGEELHVTAAQWADVLCVAPATAHTLARLALGLADDFLTTTSLMHSGPLVVAPAMHSTMWGQSTVQEHMSRLEARGAHVVGPEDGPLASGESGVGRMSKVEQIVERIEASYRGASEHAVPEHGMWRTRKILVTAGPTEEPLDDVRYLSNKSSGRMGFAVAAEAARRGAEVCLVAGPVELATPPGVRRLDVRTASEMASAVHTEAARSDVVVMAAAVADFRPSEHFDGKLKKSDGLKSIPLERTQDILGGLRAEYPSLYLVGFAAESGDVEAEALRKLESKQLDMIVANDIARPDIGFRSAENAVTIFSHKADASTWTRRPKREIASAILDRVETEWDTDGPQAFATGR